MSRGNELPRYSSSREHASGILVAALGSTFGVGLLQATGFLTDLFDTGGGGTLQVALASVALVFILLALYVAAIVTANTFGTIVAGRARSIALLRLVGASAHTLRRSVAREGLRVGAVGAAIGAVAGLAISHTALRIGIATGTLPDVAYRAIDPLIVLPVAMVVLTTWLASHVGSRAVLGVSPLQATGAAEEPAPGDENRHVVRLVFAILLVAGGTGMLALGILLGLVSPAGIIVAFFGGIASFSGVVLGARWILPATLRLVGRLFGRSSPVTLAAANAVRYPERSTRTTVGLVIGVTLVTTFAVAMTSYESFLFSEYPDSAGDPSLTITIAVLGGLIGFSAIIAAVGMVNNLSLSVLQRTRELGLLRALGFTSPQVRRMILAESAQMTIAAAGLGVLLGIGYGWAGAQALLGSLAGATLVLPLVPWPLVAMLIVGTAALAWIASIAPSRRATSVSPLTALAAT
ncbi:ABC transporter permease [Planctomonas psychrotolerans]|uniref:ABC transporter permease n=1 Tax=Planctomonas psychrotolerans TaxID=2528712 RepID=UPI0012391CB6|nr:ABC transporter permease [Planctomonas psychrotolerans]